MKLYLYKTGETSPTLEIEDAISYTANQVATTDGTVYDPLTAGYELSDTADCAGTLRADWQRNNPTVENRLLELEILIAELLFGGGEVV